MWQFLISYETKKPLELESCGDSFFQRRNIERGFEIDEDTGERRDFWQFEQRQLSSKEYETLKLELQNDEITQLQIAITELYESFLEG